MTETSGLVHLRRWAPWLVILAGLLAYSNSFNGVMVFDDVASIRENPTIRQLWPIWKPLSPPHVGGLTVEGRPLINLSLAINYALGGFNVRGYHALNLTVHILAGLTLLGIVRLTLRQPSLRERFGGAADGLALAIAVVWLVHPLQTESVTYIIQRAESIMGLFYLATLYCFIRGAESPRPGWWYSLCLIACALGMASKEVMVSAPLLVMLYDRAFVSGSLRKAWRQHRPLYLALIGTLILVGFAIASWQLPTTLANAQQVGLSRWAYLCTQPGVILNYLRLCVWPHPLSLEHVWPTARPWLSILPSAIVIVMLLGATVQALRLNSAWGFVGAWFFLILVPTSSVIPLHAVIHEHRMYLSMAAVVSAVAVGVHALMGRRSLIIFVLIAVALAVVTWRRNQDYQSELALWQDTVEKAPTAWMAHNNLANALLAIGRADEAAAHYREALRLKPEFGLAHYNLGIADFQQGDYNDAVTQFHEAVRLNPISAEAHNNLGAALAKTGQTNDAIVQFEAAAKLKPNWDEPRNNLEKMR
jgi:protein O-mannosyl-transferase